MSTGKVTTLLRKDKILGQSLCKNLQSQNHITRLSTKSEFSLCVCSDSPHSEPGTIDEADNGTEPHTSDEGQCIIVEIFHLFL